MRSIKIMCICLVFSLPGLYAGEGQGAAAPPDLTEPDVIATIDRTRTWNLGATGMRGWIYAKHASKLDNQQGRRTAASRQILVTHIGTNTPASEVMQLDDVILGVDGAAFTRDARKSLAAAIQQAEAGATDGALALQIWRNGKIMDVALTLDVMGRYSETAPYHCAKSEKILADACKVLEQEMLGKRGHIWSCVSALALMATGNPDYAPRLQDFARSLAARELVRSGGSTWDCGYPAIFLCEYYLLTGDKAVLPAIKVLTLKLAQGQSMYGTYGHAFAERTAEGNRPGSVRPYGPVNQAGLIANIAIVLGKKCGVEDPEIDAAIARASGFFGYFVDKGGIPYGEHMPFMLHGANGKHATAALFFGLQEGREREARYYAKMVTASFNNHQYGHTGQGFSHLWGPLGASVGGPEALTAYFSRTSWHADMERRSDGSFVYTGLVGRGFKPPEGDAYFGKSEYYGLSPTASYVLTYALPLRQLYITGKNPDQSKWFSQQDVDEAILAGNFDQERKHMSNDALVGFLGNWSPIVRQWAADELARRPDAHDLVPRLIEIAAAAEGPDARQSQGAVETLGLLKSEAALPVFVGLLSHEDRWLRFKAADAIKQLGDAAKPAVPCLLQALAANAAPLCPVDWEDPIQFAQGKLGEVVFWGLLRDSVEGVDRALLYPAIRAALQAPDGYARGTLSRTFRHALTLEDVMALGPDLLETIAEQGPANRMFGDGVRQAALQTLAKHRFREGMPLIIETMEINSWGKRRRIENGLKTLALYGGAARDVLPLLDQLEQELLQHREAEALQEHIELLRETRAGIEAADTREALRTLPDAGQGKDVL